MLNLSIKCALLSLASLIAISACSNASTSFSAVAVQSGFEIKQLQGSIFTHTLYKNKAPQNNKPLHVYLGGDGTPWFNGRYITDDPTPLNPVMLRLMKRDNANAIYLGRPCYHQQRMPKNCRKSLWTAERYSQKVITSMVVALKRYSHKNKYTDIKLFGFSGGGTIAMLMAPHLKKVSAVVTLGANLDTNEWTKHHSYLPLTGSLNPATQAPLAAHIQQIHVGAELDKKVPYSIIKSVTQKQTNAKFILLKNADHKCCWGSIWPALLKKSY